MLGLIPLAIILSSFLNISAFKQLTVNSLSGSKWVLDTDSAWPVLLAAPLLLTPQKTTAHFLSRYRCHSRRSSTFFSLPCLFFSLVNMNSHTGSAGGLLPTLSRSAACPSPDATPFSSVSPSPPWCLGCDPRRSRGKAWLPILDATCNCLPLSCSPQLPYTVPQRCAPLSQRIRNGLWGLRERHTRTEAATRAPEMQISSSPECKGNWKKRGKKRRSYSMGGTGGGGGDDGGGGGGGGAPAFSFFPWMSLLQKKKKKKKKII